MDIRELALGEEKLEAIVEMIADDIADLVMESGSAGIVLGVSGGIDSAVSLKLAAESGVDVRALIMPYGPGGGEDTRDAVGLAKELGIPYSLIDISPAVDAFMGSFPLKEYPGVPEDTLRVCRGNVMARSRMVYNYLAANLEGRLVLGTGNRTEILLGYGTKYGDCGVDAQPVGCLYKTQVRELARFLRVPDSIIERAPTAGLWEGQTDEAELGADYATLDILLHCLVDLGMSPSEACREAGVDAGYAGGILERVKRNSHKSSSPVVFEVFE